jgi:hypothetical protein
MRPGGAFGVSTAPKKQSAFNLISSHLPSRTKLQQWMDDRGDKTHRYQQQKHNRHTVEAGDERREGQRSRAIAAYNDNFSAADQNRLRSLARGGLTADEEYERQELLQRQSNAQELLNSTFHDIGEEHRV